MVSNATELYLCVIVDMIRGDSKEKFYQELTIFSGIAEYSTVQSGTVNTKACILVTLQFCSFLCSSCTVEGNKKDEKFCCHESL